MTQYPSGLPCPAAFTFQTPDRRAEAPAEPRLGKARRVVRDDVPRVQATFIVTEPQAATFHAWWQDDLSLGGAWFAATWPAPQGRAEYTWRFCSDPVWTLLDGVGLWSISVLLEMRERAVIPPPAPSCDCSHTAWQGNFETGEIASSRLPLLIGGNDFDFQEAQFSLSSIDPLYGTRDFQIAFMDNPQVTFNTPAVTFTNSWTMSFSVRATADLFELGHYLRFRLYDVGFSETMRLTLEGDGAGGMKFNYFHPPTFGSGGTSSLAYDTKYDCELNCGEGRYRFYVNGTEMFSSGFGGANGLNSIQLLGSGPEPVSGHAKIDEFKVTNQVEHTANYSPSLPFCTC